MQISKDEIPRLIFDFFRAIPDSGIQRISDARRKSIIVDNAYSFVSKVEINTIVKTNPLILPPIQDQDTPEIADCDDYALQLKASLTALYRQKMISTGKMILPPAIGIVITQNHALNLAICKAPQNTPSIFLIDPSLQKAFLTNDVDKSISLLKKLPVHIVYL